MGTHAGSRHKLHLGLAAGLVVAWACIGTEPGDDGGGLAVDEDLAREALRSIADQAIAPTYAEFAAAADALEQATAAWAAAEGDDIEPARAAAADAWLAAMAAWQRAELMQLGRAGSSDAIGGEGLRDEIYSWPTTNACLVDNELVVEGFDEPDFVSTRLVNVYGLDALEYLVFQTEPVNACPPQHPLNADGEWDALDPVELDARRARYAASIAAATSTVADELAADWSGTWADYLADPGMGESPYPDAAAALDELMRAAFYLDIEVKDIKIAEPAGLTCTSSCLAKLESRWAAASKQNVLANLEGFRRLYLGGESPEAGVGFDDLLVSIGEDQLASDMLARTDEAIALLEGFEGSFIAALEADPDALIEVHAAIKRVTDLLKGDFATVLALTIPSDAAGDAD